MSSKVPRNISIDRELDEWLNKDVNNAGKLISDLLRSYKVYLGNEMEAVRYILEKRVHDTADEV